MEYLIYNNVELKHVEITPSINELINRVFPDLYSTPLDNVILCPLNSSVNAINDMIIDEIPGQSTTYTSIDSSLSEDGQATYPVEFLNTVNIGSLPPHKLKLKVGTPIIVLRNINHPIMVNGTRAIVSRLHRNTIEAFNKNGTMILIPRITLVPTDASNGIIFRRKQFLVRPCYSMTINRAQGQDMITIVGLDLRSECFNHGQLCVALSRTHDPKDILVLSSRGNIAKNPVFKDCLHN